MGIKLSFHQRPCDHLHDCVYVRTRFVFGVAITKSRARTHLEMAVFTDPQHQITCSRDHVITYACTRGPRQGQTPMANLEQVGSEAARINEFQTRHPHTLATTHTGRYRRVGSRHGQEYLVSWEVKLSRVFVAKPSYSSGDVRCRHVPCDVKLN
jgi:hypothetical protein